MPSFLLQLSPQWLFSMFSILNFDASMKPDARAAFEKHINTVHACWASPARQGAAGTTIAFGYQVPNSQGLSQCKWQYCWPAQGNEQSLTDPSRSRPRTFSVWLRACGANLGTHRCEGPLACTCSKGNLRSISSMENLALTEPVSLLILTSCVEGHGNYV